MNNQASNQHPNSLFGNHVPASTMTNTQQQQMSDLFNQSVQPKPVSPSMNMFTNNQTAVSVSNNSNAQVQAQQQSLFNSSNVAVFGHLPNNQQVNTSIFSPPQMQQPSLFGSSYAPQQINPTVANVPPANMFATNAMYQQVRSYPQQPSLSPFTSNPMSNLASNTSVHHIPFSNPYNGGLFNQNYHQGPSHANETFNDDEAPPTQTIS